MVDDVWIAPLGATRGETAPPPGKCDISDVNARAEWFASHGGVLAGSQIFRVEVVNDSDKTLVVDGLRLSSVEVLPAIQGTGETICPGAGGPFDTQYAVINLDARPREFKYFNETFSPIPAVEFAPEPHQPLRFWVQATAEDHRYRWTAELEYSLDGERYTATVGDSKEPFEITGCAYGENGCRAPPPPGAP